jgi:hypothetical protein
MAKKPKKLMRRQAGLTETDLEFLISGFVLFVGECTSFDPTTEGRKFYRQHRKQLLGMIGSKEIPWGMRPYAWWRWQHDEPLVDLHRKFSDGLSMWKTETRRQSFEWLRDNGYLLDNEETEFEQQESAHKQFLRGLNSGGPV